MPHWKWPCLLELDAPKLVDSHHKKAIRDPKADPTKRAVCKQEFVYPFRGLRFNFLTLGGISSGQNNRLWVIYFDAFREVMEGRAQKNRSICKTGRPSLPVDFQQKIPSDSSCGNYYFYVIVKVSRCNEVVNVVK